MAEKEKPKMTTLRVVQVNTQSRTAMANLARKAMSAMPIRGSLGKPPKK